MENVLTILVVVSEAVIIYYFFKLVETQKKLNKKLKEGFDKNKYKLHDSDKTHTHYNKEHFRIMIDEFDMAIKSGEDGSWNKSELIEYLANRKAACERRMREIDGESILRTTK